MNRLILGFADTVPAIAEFFREVLSERYEVIVVDDNPDYLIFGDRNFGEKNLSYKDCIKIFYTGENQRPWDYQAHFGLTFDHFDTENLYRLPIYVIYNWDNARKGVRTYEQRERSENDLKQSKDFCSFVVRNPSCQMRNQFFHKLSAYKQVNSGGPLFNNIGGVLSDGDDGIATKLNFLDKHKFNMCFENSSYPGYTTEKLFQALLAKTIPIYWGDPVAAMDFNPKAFLNWHDYQDDDLFLEVIREYDNDPKLYEEMYMQPMFSRLVPNKYLDMNRFLNWFDRNVYKGSRG